MGTLLDELHAKAERASPPREMDASPLSPLATPAPLPDPARRRPFLTARWSNLLILSYPVDAAVLAPLIPPGCEPDLVEGRAIASVVAFDFLDARIRGIRWPGCVNFPEVNLRYYVRQRPHARRGVAFVRELVPSRFLAASARWTYNEPFAACPMRSTLRPHGPDALSLRHEFDFAGARHAVEAVGGPVGRVPLAGSAEHWLTTHRWGFGRDRRGRGRVFEVQHPAWAMREVRSWSVNMDFGRLYGPQWACLRDIQPCSVLWAVGSEVVVYPQMPL